MFKVIAKIFGKRSADEELGNVIMEGRNEDNALLTDTPVPTIPTLSLQMPSYQWRYIYDDGLVGISGLANAAQSSGIMNDVFGALRLDLALAQRMLGEDSPQLIDMLTNLAQAAGSEGAERASDEYTDRAITLAEMTNDKSKKSNALMRRGELRMDAGRMEEAQALYDEAVALRREALGENHPHVTALVDFAARMRAGDMPARDKGPARDAFADFIEKTRSTIPSGRLGVAETLAREALNVASCDLGGFSAEALEALSLLGTVLSDAKRPNAALSHLLHACDVAYVREGEDSRVLADLIAQARKAIQDAPRGDHDLGEGGGVITVSRSDSALHNWVIPHLNGGGTNAEIWPISRPLWNTIDAAFVSPQLRDSGWLDANPQAEAVFVTFAIAANGIAQDIIVDQSSGNAELDQLVLERVGNLRFARMKSISKGHRQEVWIYPQSLHLPGPEALLIERDCMIVQYDTEAENGDLWVMPCPQAADLVPKGRQSVDQELGDSGVERTAGVAVIVPKLRKGEIAASDYPSRAVREDREGTVILAITICPQGRVENATVVQTSGHDDLDRAAVQVITRRFRYEPAQDTNGNPCAFTMEQTVKWQL